ncbi:MAG: MFS transporter [Candidatus Eremiobacteraeota bacterium]|nr:MFS transporter [Candidatus Eremiobacteraeota bacterium]
MASDDQNMHRRALIASLIGSSIEWYDFFLYGTVTALVFAKRFFPGGDPNVALLQAYATFAIPFFIRPLGGIVFSHLGDKVGRKVSLVLTLALMGSATVLIGCVPDYQAIGGWAPTLLIVLRFVQGLGLGGEWGGALLLAIEHARPGQRGFYGSIPQMGVTVGLLLGTLAVTLVSLLPEESFLSWGWRLPFLASVVLVFVGLWIRKGIEETPAFREARHSGTIARFPIAHTFRYHWREVLLAVGLKVVETGPFYIFSTFIISYAVNQCGFSKMQALNAVTIGTIVSTALIPIGGVLADRLGRKPLYIAGSVGILAFAFPYFAMVNAGSVPLLVGATVIALGILWSPVTAVLGTLYSELFATNVRYTGVTIGYQLGAALAGGTAPFVATWMLGAYHNSSMPISLYLVACCAISLACIATLRETKGSELNAGTAASGRA